MSNNSTAPAPPPSQQLDPQFVSENSVVWAVMALFAWLVPHVFITVAEARWEIASSERWLDSKLERGLHAITNHAAIAVAAATAVIAATAAGISLSTRNMDVNML